MKGDDESVMKLVKALEEFTENVKTSEDSFDGLNRQLQGLIDNMNEVLGDDGIKDEQSK